MVNLSDTKMTCVCELATWVLAGLGGLVAARWVLGFLAVRLFGGINLKKLGAKQGGWAVVTGASDGIGKGYALELAKRGFNIMLISRTEAKLKAVAEEIENKYKVKTDVLAIDFINADNATFEAINNAIGKLGGQVGVLVNNVGINYDYPLFFLEADGKLDQDIVNVNINVTNKMTKLVLPRMLEHKAGAVINLSSMSGLVPTPMLAVYSGTKAYINFFSQCLSSEYKSRGIVAQSVTPGLVVSNMSKVRKTSLMVASPEAIASASIDTLGKRLEYSPHWFHRLIIAVQLAMPRSFALGFLRDYNVKIQKAALRKQNLRTKKN